MNNDRFKFRAWDNSAKEWLLGYEMPNLGGFSMFGELMLFEKWAEVLDRFTLQQKDRKPEDLKLMQCTGLKDKNGKLIYEGDIVKEYDEGPCVVEWQNDLYSLNCYCGKPWSQLGVIEVIGNIYENPELINF